MQDAKAPGIALDPVNDRIGNDATKHYGEERLDWWRVMNHHLMVKVCLVTSHPTAITKELQWLGY